MTRLYCIVLYLSATRLQLQKDTKKCRKKRRGGQKETIKLMSIRPPQLQFFKDGIKIITATEKKYYQMEN